jgi:hypothetical protein
VLALGFGLAALISFAILEALPAFTLVGTLPLGTFVIVRAVPPASFINCLATFGAAKRKSCAPIATIIGTAIIFFLSSY